MYPHERSLVKQLAGQPFTIIGVNSDTPREKIQQVVKDKNLTWRSFWNGPEGTMGPISKAWNVSGWPTIYLIDAKGVIRHKNVRGDRLDRAIEELLAEMGHPVQIEHPKDSDDEAKPSEDADGEPEA